MITFLNEIHFWTTQEDVIIKSTDYGSFKYISKKEPEITLYSRAKKQFCESSGIILILNNKQPKKLRDRLKEFEEYLLTNKIVYCLWNENRLKILLSTGLIVRFTIDQNTGDLLSIFFDKQLSLRLQVNIICDGILFGNQVICVCNDGHVLGYGGLWKDGWVLEGGPRKRLHYRNDWLVVYGRAEVEHPQPWSPLTKDHKRCNLLLYFVGARDPELLAFRKIDGEPLLVIVSKIYNRTITVVEQKVSQKGAVSLDVSNFELIGDNLKRISVISVPLQTQVSCYDLSEDEDRLLVGCIDGSLAILDRSKGTTKTIKGAFIPTFANWHPEGVVVAVANERGLIQYYDAALNCVQSQLISEDYTPSSLFDLSTYFNLQFNVVSINWGPKDLIIFLEQGPLVILTHTEGSLSFRAIALRYIKLDRIEKAVKLLLSWEFNDKAFFILQKIVAQLLREPLTDEIAQCLQDALGSFHSPSVPLPSHVRHKYGHQVSCLTRRFFHQLVRAQMFETAFLLAVDMGQHDLFMDLHYIAVKIGNTEMAAAARAQASALLSRCASKTSLCSRSSCSQCSDTKSSSSSSQDDEEEPDRLNIMNSEPKFGSFAYEPHRNSGNIVNTGSEFTKFNFHHKLSYIRPPQIDGASHCSLMGKNWTDGDLV